MVVFFLQISNSTTSQFPRLLSRLYHPECLYIVHFDADIAPEVGKKLVAASNLGNGQAQPRNVRLLPQEAINYRGVSMTLNTLAAMTLALEVSKSWRYFINLSGADYPTVSPTVIRQLLAHAGPPRVFLTRPVPGVARRIYMNRASNFYVDPALAFTKRKGAAYDSGSRNPLTVKLAHRVQYSEAWMIAHRGFCSYATNSANSRRLLISLGYMLSSPEHFFATLLSLSPFKKDHIGTSLRLIKWEWQGQSAGQHPFALDRLYDSSERPASHQLVKVPFLFARKFTRRDSALKDMYDERARLPERVRYVTWHFNAYLGIEKWADRPPVA